MIKLLQINATYGLGSTGIIAKELSDICIDAGIETYIAYSKGYGQNDISNAYEIGSWLDHKVHAVCSRIAGKQGYYSKRSTINLIKYISSVSPDIVHLHNLHSNYIHLNTLLEYLSAKNIPTVITMHDCWFFTGGCFHYTSVCCEKWKFSCGNCIKRHEDTPALLYDASPHILKDRVRLFSSFKNLTFIGVSNWIVDEFRKSRLRTFAKVECIYNGFDLNVFKPSESNLRDKLGLNGKFVILGPATKWLRPINKPTLEYFSRNIDTDTVLLLFGHNREDIKLPDNVIFYGFTKSRSEMVELYSMADVMVNCSREDTLSSLNIEAQACGTPVVTYDATGSKETVNDVCGFAVETGNYDLLFKMTENVRRLGKKEFSKDCRNFVENHFEKQSNYVKYIDVYKKILE